MPFCPPGDLPNPGIEPRSPAWQADSLPTELSGKPDFSLQFSSVAQSCLTLCDPMNRSTPGLPVQHQPPEFTQTRIHRVSDAIQPSHPWSSPSPPAPNPSQHQSLPMSQLFATLEVKSLSRVRLFATPWTSSLPGSSLHGILQARVLEWDAIAFSHNALHILNFLWTEFV